MNIVEIFAFLFYVAFSSITNWQAYWRKDPEKLSLFFMCDAVVLLFLAAFNNFGPLFGAIFYFMVMELVMIGILKYRESN